jgi:hypothetical protein
MSGSSSNDELGCGGCIVAILLIGAVIGAIISVAALIDPFSWMPPVGEIWAECEDDYATSADECDLAERYPGFWGHVAVNFAYAVASAVALGWLARGALELRAARAERFSAGGAIERYRAARESFGLTCCGCGAMAVLPTIVAVL